MPYIGLNRPVSSYSQTRRIRGDIVTDCVTPERVYEHFRSGAVIEWFSLNHFFPNLRELTTMLAERFAVRSEAVGFLTPAGTTEGSGCHEDPVDIFIIQIEGSKSWRLWDTARPHRPEVVRHPPGELGEPSLEFDLEPGDVLYMPHNTPHQVTAKDEMSLHLSVAIKPRPWSDLLTRVVEDIVDSGDRHHAH
jgi:ribosomal protein L16 Arg81 hydroxylase